MVAGLEAAKGVVGLNCNPGGAGSCCCPRPVELLHVHEDQHSFWHLWYRMVVEPSSGREVSSKKLIFARNRNCSPVTKTTEGP